MRHCKTRSIVDRLLILSISILIISCSAERRIQHFNDTAAAPESQADRVITTIEIRNGDNVADLGAGRGYFTEKLSRAVGKEETVYAIDINQEYIALLDKSLKRKNIENVKLVLADEKGLDMPERSLDLLFARNVFHEIDDQATYFRNIKKLLKPRSRIVIIDPKPDIGISLFEKYPSEETIVNKMKEAGFVRINRYDFLSKQWFSIFEPAKK